MTFPKIRSVVIRDTVLPFWRNLRRSRSKCGMLMMAIAAILWITRRRSLDYYTHMVKRSSMSEASNTKGKNMVPSVGKSRICPDYLKKLKYLLGMVLPRVGDRDIGWILLMFAAMAFRTLLSIRLADINAGITKAMIKHNFPLFVKRLILLAGHALPASFINSYMEYLMKRLALGAKTRMTEKFLDLYLQNKAVFHLTNLDTRISNPEQRMTQDIDKWSHTMCSVLFNTIKPCLDIILFSKELSHLLGWQGPTIVICWYLLSAVVIRFVSPPFVKLLAVERKLDYDYRLKYRMIADNADQIAMTNMEQIHKEAVLAKHRLLTNHIKSVASKRLYFGTFDSLLVKYGAVLFGYGILSFPIFGRSSGLYLKEHADDPAQIIRDYVRHSSLTINLAKGIGRLVVSYKDLGSMYAQTESLYEMFHVLQDLNKGVYSRQTKADMTGKRTAPQRGNQERSNDMVQMQRVPLMSPDGETAQSPLSFQVQKGQHCLILGADSFSKKTMTRLLFELWPLCGGTVTRPDQSNLIFVPEKSVFPEMRLRDILIRPRDQKTIPSGELQKWFKILGIESMFSNLDTSRDWNMHVSSSKRQKLAILRLICRQPTFALLDNAMSVLSAEVTDEIYGVCKARGITLMTMAPFDYEDELSIHHKFVLKLDEKRGEWTFNPIPHTERTKSIEEP